MRIVSGLQSSGRLHIGNWFGAVRQLVRYQESDEAFDFIADLHALTTVRDGERARALTVGVCALQVREGNHRSEDPEVPELSQHVEFARDWVTRFNIAHVQGYDPQHPGGSADHCRSPPRRRSLRNPDQRGDTGRTRPSAPIFAARCAAKSAR